MLMRRLDYDKGVTRRTPEKANNSVADVIRELRVNPWGDMLNRDTAYVEVLHTLSGWGVHFYRSRPVLRRDNGGGMQAKVGGPAR